MGDNVIKFGKAKKALARKTKEKQAGENRKNFGRTKAEKKQDQISKDKFERHLDGHKREE